MKQKIRKVGVIGCGAIGTVIVDFLSKGKIPHLQLKEIFDIDRGKLDKVARKYKDIEISNGIDELITKVDLVVECAGVAVVRKCVELCIDKRKDLLVLSVGGLLDCQDLFGLAENVGIKILAPSGAVSGIDAVKASSIGKIKQITLTTFKPPRGLEGVDYIEKKGINLSTIDKDTEVFYGTVKEAVKHFPKNINVAATISLASGLHKNMYVRIIASPLLATNVHELKVEGEHGRIITRTENVPSPSNPRTSFMAVLSALRRLSDYEKTGLLVGT